MKCEEVRTLLADYADSALAAPAAQGLRAHLRSCADCAAALRLAEEEQELYAWYMDDLWRSGDIELGPELWAGVSEKIAARRRPRRFALLRSLAWPSAAQVFKPVLAAAAALLLAATALWWALSTGVRWPDDGGDVSSAPNNTVGASVGVSVGGETPLPDATVDNKGSGAFDGEPDNSRQPTGSDEPRRFTADVRTQAQRLRLAVRDRKASAVRQTEPADGRTASGFDGGAEAEVADVHQAVREDAEVAGMGQDSETVRHFDQAQILLRSFRHADSLSSGELTYEREQSRRLLRRNVLLRLGAASKGDLGVEQALGSIEPVLLDISHLPDDASPAELRTIRERIERGELLATLRVYQAQPPLP